MQTRIMELLQMYAQIQTYTDTDSYINYDYKDLDFVYFSSSHELTSHTLGLLMWICLRKQKHTHFYESPGMPAC